jgi:hypothetical protein
MHPVKLLLDLLMPFNVLVKLLYTSYGKTRFSLASLHYQFTIVVHQQNNKEYIPTSLPQQIQRKLIVSQSFEVDFSENKMRIELWFYLWIMLFQTF